MVSEHTRIQQLVDGLAEVIDRPTAIDDPDFRLLFHSPQHGPLDEVRVRSILDRDSPAAAKDWVRAQGVARAEGVHRLHGDSSVGMLPRAFVPIRHEQRLLGYLWIIDAAGDLAGDHDEDIERVARDLGPLLYRRHAEDLLDRRRRRTAVLALLDESAVVRDRAAGRLVDGQVLRVHRDVVALAIGVVAQRASTLTASDLVALEMGIERTRARAARHDVVHATDGPSGVVVLAPHPGVDPDPTPVVEALHADLVAALRPHRVVIGVGGARTDLPAVRDSYVEAATAVRALARLPHLGDVGRHDGLGVHAVLARLPDDELDASLLPAGLRRLLDADEPDLVHTLTVFLDLAGDVARAAAALHVHRSTVYGRLRRIEDLTGLSLTDGADRLQLHLGLATAPWLGRTSPPDLLERVPATGTGPGAAPR